MISSTMSASTAVPTTAVPATAVRTPEGRPATEPPEARGLTRDGVRLLVGGVGRGRIEHTAFAGLPRFLTPGDLVVVNTSATLPAALPGRRSDGRQVAVHLSTMLDTGLLDEGDTWAVEVRPPGKPTGPVDDLAPGETLRLPDHSRADVIDSYPEAGHEKSRLWRAVLTTNEGVDRLLARYGMPISYAYVPKQWPLASYQTVFARHPGSAEMPRAGSAEMPRAGSAEMPSAARPFTAALVTELISSGIAVAPITLHTGVSSQEAGEPPLPERFSVPVSTARLVNHTVRHGGRIIAVGTTVTRALESAADHTGQVSSSQGWTDLVLGPHRPARVVNGLITGWHARGASHLDLLEAVVGADLVGRAYSEAVSHDYLWHEFGDSALLLA